MAMKRFLVKSKLGIGRDFNVYDDEEAKNKVYYIDAKMGLGTKAEILSSDRKLLYKAKGRILNIPRKMEYFSSDGDLVAKVVARFSPIKSRLTMELANGSKWELAGNILGINYIVVEGDKKIIEINQKWVTIRDKYFVEISEDVDAALALGLVWAIDIWREGKNN
ncbi:MAG: LURP-one-related family protein [Patescibacteria group bacterium]|jgi:uncharacterized protein YxjI|nr:LURP-one-related family protein [Patescibacteria group bacterium]